MIGFVLLLKYPAPSQPETTLVEPVIEAPPVDLQEFLNEESGNATALVSLTPSANSEPGQVKKQPVIPMNVVPQQQKSVTVKPKQATITRPQRKQTTTASVVHTPGFSSKERNQLQLADAQATQLVNSSTDAFRRGLLSLSEYHLALNIGFENKQKVADFRQVRRARINLLKQKRELFQQAVEQLQAFDQPAAQGWYGDLVHAKLLLSQNQYELAAETKDAALQRAALIRISNLSKEYFAIRKVELDVGEADLSEFRRASRSVYVANQEQYFFNSGGQQDAMVIGDYVRELESIQDEVEWMASRGAGLGRNDLLNLSKAHLAYMQGKYYQLQDQDERSQNAFQDSMEYSRAAWNERINRYFPVGTASLHDLTASWIMWNAAGSEFSESQLSRSSQVHTELQTGLDRIVNIADRIRDHRGRMASDISLVHSLKSSDFLNQLGKSKAR